jgi:hypothetical protein
METIRLFVADYIRLMRGLPVLGAGVDRTSEEIDARATGKRFSRGSVALQEDLAISESDFSREYDEVANYLKHN